MTISRVQQASLLVNIQQDVDDSFLVVLGLLLALLLLLSLAAISLLQCLHALFADFCVAGIEGLQIIGLYNSAQLDLFRLLAILRLGVTICRANEDR